MQWFITVLLKLHFPQMHCPSQCQMYFLANVRCTSQANVRCTALANVSYWRLALLSFGL